MIANKVYSCAEMREERIFTGDYRFIDKEGEYFATLIMRVEASSGMLRLFFRLVNGEKIITPVYWCTTNPFCSEIDFQARNRYTGIAATNEKGGISILKTQEDKQYDGSV